MKKILIATVLFFLSSVSSVSACGYFKILSEYGVPVFNSYGYLIINGSSYPPDQKMILYNLTVDNLDYVGVELTFVPTGDLINYVYGATEYVEAYSKKNVSLNVYVDGPFREGILYVEGSCSNGFVEGVIPVRIYGRGNGPPQTCLNTINSCGIFPNCTDLNTLNGCYSGYYRSYYCSNNMIKYSETCTSYCCDMVQGTCVSGKCSVDPVTTTTTSTTTTTIPQTTTTVPTTSGCYDGYYRNYYYSNNQWKYSETCTSYCCNLVGGKCQAGVCSVSGTSTTTTTISQTTTTTIPSNCNDVLSLSGCYSGYYRSYYCSNNHLEYSETCTSYCCNLVGGKCKGGSCSGGSTSTTTTTLTTTTTTIPSACTNSYAVSLNGCYSGYYRSYYCSNNHLEYSETCTSYCCNLVGGKCKSSACVVS